MSFVMCFTCYLATCFKQHWNLLLVFCNCDSPKVIQGTSKFHRVLHGVLFMVGKNEGTSLAALFLDERIEYCTQFHLGGKIQVLKKFGKTRFSYFKACLLCNFMIFLNQSHMVVLVDCSQFSCVIYIYICPLWTALCNSIVKYIHNYFTSILL